MTTIDAAELAELKSIQSIHIKCGAAEMFHWWIATRLVQEPPGRYRLTHMGLRVACGLLEVEVLAA